MSAEQVVNEKWGLAIPPMPNAFTQVVDVCANAFSVLKTIPDLLTRWNGMRSAFDNFLQVRLGRAIDSYYRITKENQLAAVLLMNPSATQGQLFDMCVGVQNCRPDTVRELQTQDVDARNLRDAQVRGTAAGFVPPGA